MKVPRARAVGVRRRPCFDLDANNKRTLPLRIDLVGVQSRDKEARERTSQSGLGLQSVACKLLSTSSSNTARESGTS